GTETYGSRLIALSAHRSSLASGPNASLQAVRSPDLAAYSMAAEASATPMAPTERAAPLSLWAAAAAVTKLPERPAATTSPSASRAERADFRSSDVTSAAPWPSHAPR